MKIQLSHAKLSSLSVDMLALAVFDGELSTRDTRAGLGELDRLLEGDLTKAIADEAFRGSPEATLTLHTGGRLRCQRLVLVGLGKRDRFGTEALRHAAAIAVKAAGRCSADSLALTLPGEALVEDEVRAAAEGALLGAYRFDRYRSEKRKRPDRPRLLLLQTRASDARSLRETIALAEEIGGAVAWARDLVNEPAGSLTPTRLAEEAVEMARARGLRSELLGPAMIRKLRMGMFLGVAQGSAEEPRLVHVFWEPRGAAARKPPLAIIGKAITFDSGGLSLKPSDGMMDMKTDMAGAATALAAMRVIATLRPPFPVHAFLGACENMPGGRAYKLGDVLTSRLGKTVEITNTDAEGRLVLGDVLAWAAEWKPSAMIDLATLTGACVVALGHWTAGAFSPNDALAEELLLAARASGEDVWRMPMTEWVKETLKSDVADLRNSGERPGGAIAAAHFLREFVGTTPWLHLDIAGPAFSKRERGYLPKGGTGVGVRTLVELVRRRMQ
ncbi:MAG: leucyl aminopeptidase [Deltaproteobacteria bacterium]